MVDQQQTVVAVHQSSSHLMVSVCGRVTGYQYGAPDVVNPHVNNINSYYLDGVSITHHLVNTFGAFTVV